MRKFSPLLMVLLVAACSGGQIDTNTASTSTGGTTPGVQTVEFSTDEDTPTTADLGEAASTSGTAYTVVSEPTNGSVTLGESGEFTYTPAADFNGSDSFGYAFTNGAGDGVSGTATIAVNSVNDLPVAAAQALTTDEDTVASGQASATDADHAPSELRYRLAQAASSGAASVSETGALGYTPNTDFNGSDFFVIEVFDPENGTDTARVDITVNEVADAPNGANDALNILVAEDTLFNGQLAVTDPDGDTITYQLSDTDGETAQFGIASVDTETGNYSYQPIADYNGGNSDSQDFADDSFRVVVLENGLEAGRITANIEVTPVNDPPVAVEGFYGTQVDTLLNGRLPATDIDGDTLTFAVAEGVAEGGDLTVNNDGSFEYAPPTGQALESSFTFTVSDGQETSPPATASIAVVESLGQSTDQTLTALAGPSPAQVGTPPPPGPPVSIYFTVHEPTNFSPNQKYPLVLEGHGYGGSRTNAGARNNGGFKGLLNSGYGVISITQRGFGRLEGQTDTGNIRLFDPNYEGRDLMQVIDWAEDNLDWLLYKNSSGAVVDKTDPDANVVLGAIGGSYGGGYQHTIAAIDSKRRIDALAAEITWYDLRYSLFSGNVFKSYWAGLLSAAGNGTGSQDPEVNQGLAQGVGGNFLDDDKLQLLYDHSFISHCENNSVYTHNVTATDGQGTANNEVLDPVDALYWQSPSDSLFNMNEMHRNTACMRARGADVRALTKVNGHDGGVGDNCGPHTVNQTVRDWFDEKLKGIPGQADDIPDNCFNLRVNNETAQDHIVTDTFPVGGTAYEIDDNGQDAGGDPVSLTANGNNQSTIEIPLFTATEETIIAGIPTAQLTLDGPLAPPDGTPDPGLLPTDPIVFIGLTVGDTLQMANQVRPIRQYGTHDIELVGLNVKVPAGTDVKLTIYSGFLGRYPGSGTNQPTPVTVQGVVQLPLH